MALQPWGKWIIFIKTCHIVFKGKKRFVAPFFYSEYYLFIFWSVFHKGKHCWTLAPVKVSYELGSVRPSVRSFFRSFVRSFVQLQCKISELADWFFFWFFAWSYKVRKVAKADFWRKKMSWRVMRAQKVLNMTQKGGFWVWQKSNPFICTFFTWIWKC